MTMTSIEVMTIVVIREILVLIREMPVLIGEILILVREMPVLIRELIFMTAHTIEFIVVPKSVVCKFHAYILSRARCDQQSQRHYRQHQLNRVDLNSSIG